jgi:hypothetical protein
MLTMVECMTCSAPAAGASAADVRTWRQARKNFLHRTPFPALAGHDVRSEHLTTGVPQPTNSRGLRTEQGDLRPVRRLPSVISDRAESGIWRWLALLPEGWGGLPS